MRVTLRISDDLHAAAKEHAARIGKPLGALVEEALRAALERESARTPAPPRRLPTFGSGGLRPGVELDRSARLLGIMDRENEPR